MMRRYISILSIFILLTCSSCFESFDKRLQREAREFTENHCPQVPEPGTLLDSTTYDITSRTYTLWYSLSTANAEVYTANIPLLHQALLERLLDDVNYKSLKDHNVIFRYVYTSQQNRRVIYQTQIGPNEYACR